MVYHTKHSRYRNAMGPWVKVRLVHPAIVPTDLYDDAIPNRVPICFCQCSNLFFSAHAPIGFFCPLSDLHLFEWLPL